jgi:GT2 family glycosyltransferase
MNNLALTKRTVESLRKQNMPVAVHIVDNGSTDGTVDWAREEGILLHAFPFNAGVSAGWNRGLMSLFSDGSIGRVFVINNDVILPPFFMRELISYDQPFVTGIAVDDLEIIKTLGQRQPLQPHPDFSAYMIRREAWDRIGRFDDRMKLYCSDCDYHVRGHKLGVGMWKANVPYYHERSSTMRLAPPEEQAAIHAQANKDRQVFLSIYNTVPGQKDYEAMFK